MEKYTIYCTPEQTKKALELGAPIVQYKAAYVSELFPYCVEYKDDVRVVTVYPTAEQMIGWLEEQGFFISIVPDTNENTCANYVETKEFSIGNVVHSSRKEATLAAIDKALEYLKEQKERRNNNGKRR